MITKNIFFNLADLKRVGKNVIIGKTVRIRYPELVEIGDNVIIDDFTYISTALKLEDYTHISSGCKLIGGQLSKIHMMPFSTLSPGVVLAAGSDDYSAGIATPLVPEEYKAEFIRGAIVVNRHCIVGSNSVVLPNVELGAGVSIGALSLVNKNLDPWKIYAGVPAQIVGNRKKDQTLALERAFLEGRKN